MQNPYSSTRTKIAETLTGLKIPPEWISSLKSNFLDVLPAENQEIISLFQTPSYSKCLENFYDGKDPEDKINALAWITHSHFDTLKSDKINFTNLTTSVDDTLLRTEVLYRIGHLQSPSQQADSVEKVFNNNTDLTKNLMEIFKNIVVSLIRKSGQTLLDILENCRII
jgi:hypothetical protein